MGNRKLGKLDPLFSELPVQDKCGTRTEQTEREGGLGGPMEKGQNMTQDHGMGCDGDRTRQVITKNDEQR